MITVPGNDENNAESLSVVLITFTVEGDWKGREAGSFCLIPSAIHLILPHTCCVRDKDDWGLIRTDLFLCNLYNIKALEGK